MRERVTNCESNPRWYDISTSKINLSCCKWLQIV